jgi:4-hydroxy-tetrahydrodipicolinate synthase
MTHTRPPLRTASGALPAGSIPALVTPMHEDGSLDWSAYRALIDWHVEAGSAAIVVLGSTGEAATVSMEEHNTLIHVAVEHARGRIPIIAGTGANSTSEAVELAQFAKDAGALAALSVVPYYNKPTQEGMFCHFETIADAVDLPIILYNVPGRTVADLSNETVLRLAEIPNIVGLKDATGDIGRGVMLMRSLPADFVVYSGDDPSAAALILHGAHGNISVTANVVPTLMGHLCAAARRGDVATVRAISRRIAPLHEAMFVESNPIPVKWALAQMGKLSASYRSPMVPLSPSKHTQVANALRLALEDSPSTEGLRLAR